MYALSLVAEDNDLLGDIYGRLKVSVRVTIDIS